MNKERTSVLVVDDSAVIRSVMTELLTADPAIEVIGAVADPIFALHHMQQQWPDVIVLDVEMPRMDGITFLRKIMAQRPTPVIICSSLTAAGAETTLRALAAGALEIVTKPKMGVKGFLEHEANTLRQLVKTAARVGAEKLAANAPKCAVPIVSKSAPQPEKSGERVVAIGTSTGGTRALEKVLGALPRQVPGIVIVQHMPEKFTSAFASRLNDICEIEVREACDSDCVLPGVALIAPGGKHMCLRRDTRHYYVEVSDGPVVNHHRPSVDVLFRSAAKAAGPNALGVIMTGMGDDGAQGIFEMREAGARTIAQDEESCVVFGMPKEAIKLGGIASVMPLEAVAHEIVRHGAACAQGAGKGRLHG